MPMILRGVLILSLFFCVQIPIQAQQVSEKVLQQLKPGMSDVQVKQIIGEPINSENFATVGYQTSDTSVYWRYGNEQVIVLTNHLFNRIEPNRDQLLRYVQQHAFQQNAQGLIIVSYGKK